MTREEFEAKKITNRTKGAKATLEKAAIVATPPPSDAGDSTMDSISILGEDSEDDGNHSDPFKMS